MPTAGWWEALWPDPAGVLRAVGVTSGMDVIDLCSGDGWFTLQIARMARQVAAIDIDSSLLETARHRIMEAGLTNCEFIEGDAYELGRLWREPVDFVFMANAFHGVPDRSRLVVSVGNVLKPSGRFAVVNWHPRPRHETTVLGEPRGPRTEMRLSVNQTLDAVTVGGFQLVTVVEIPPYHYGAIFKVQPTEPEKVP